ncbi:hypothetical protein, partial [Spirosoma validum]|uniref:hypothetical protein n=1 Tax=Spirosoma validum TaxID=2771355 RepID=UPI001CC31889
DDFVNAKVTSKARTVVAGFDFVVAENTAYSSCQSPNWATVYRLSRVYCFDSINAPFLKQTIERQYGQNFNLYYNISVVTHPLKKYS